MRTSYWQNATHTVFWNAAMRAWLPVGDMHCTACGVHLYSNKNTYVTNSLYAFFNIRPDVARRERSRYVSNMRVYVLTRCESPCDVFFRGLKSCEARKGYKLKPSPVLTWRVRLAGRRGIRTGT